MRRLDRKFGGNRRRQSEFVDFTTFEESIAMYRARGAKIGCKVRLLGVIDGLNPHLVSIGDYVVLGVNSALLAHCPIKGPLPVSIGDYSYIAYGALILPGVSVGKCCIVGAGSVVTRSVADETIVAGNPARVLRKLTDREREKIVHIMRTGRFFGRDFAVTGRPVSSTAIGGNAFTEAAHGR